MTGEQTALEQDVKQYKTRNTVKFEYKGEIKEWIDKRDIKDILLGFVKFNKNKTE